jgi:hypothetical protein
MKYIVTPPILKDEFIVWPFLTAVIFLIVGFSVSYIRLADVQNLLIIHFDSFRGIDFLGDKQDVFGILAVGLAVMTVNGFLANVFYYRERFFSYLLSFSSVVLSLLILIAVFAIISIN